MNPTKTTNRFHFEDLSHERFEDMCYQISFRYKDWEKFNHFGRSGSEGGKDIYAEITENEVKRIWIFQCKRYKRIFKKDLEKELNNFLNNADNKIPDVYVFIVASSVSKKTHEAIISYGKNKGFKEILIWDASFIEAILYANHPDILSCFFGIQSFQRRLNNSRMVTRRLRIKKRLKSSFDQYYRNEDIQRDVIVHNIDYDIYPNIPETHTISSWFRLGYLKDYFRGISLYAGGIVYVAVNCISKKWSFCEYNDTLPENTIRINVHRMIDIPYDNIVDFDMEGDEYYSYPHIYCQFNNAGWPHERIWYLPAKEEERKIIKLHDDHTVTILG